MVLSPIGCGFENHPPEEVAKIFKKEMYRVGKELPFICFAVLDKRISPDGEDNYSVFRRILQRPKAGEPDERWQSAQALYNESVMVMAHDDFADDRALGDASVRRGETELPHQADDDSMGVAPLGAGSDCTRKWRLIQVCSLLILPIRQAEMRRGHGECHPLLLRVQTSPILKRALAPKFPYSRNSQRLQTCSRKRIANRVW